MVASGVKQKNIQDRFDLENFLDLTQIVPLQSSYTQTSSDRESQKDASPSDKTSQVKEEEQSNDVKKEEK